MMRHNEEIPITSSELGYLWRGLYHVKTRMINEQKQKDDTYYT